MIHHIGVVAQNVEAIKPLRAIMGLSGEFKFLDKADVKTWKCDCYLYRIDGGDTLFEVVVPYAGKLLEWTNAQEWPMTMHHLALRVDNIDEKCRALSQFGVKLISEKPVGTFPRWRVNFVHPSYCGVMLELVELI